MEEILAPSSRPCIVGLVGRPLHRHRVPDATPLVRVLVGGYLSVVVHVRGNLFSSSSFLLSCRRHHSQHRSGPRSCSTGWYRHRTTLGPRGVLSEVRVLEVLIACAVHEVLTIYQFHLVHAAALSANG